MQLNRQNQSRNRTQRQPESLGAAMTNLLDSYQPLLSRKNIKLVKDLDEVITVFNSELIESAVRALIDNAIQSMPLGGELSAILINEEHQWELEIADTVWPSRNAIVRQSTNNDPQSPVILPFPENEYLRVAHRSAIAHGGHIQTWKCPLGGTAHVITISKQRY